VEGKAPGHPLGFDGYQEFGPIEMVGGEVGGTKAMMLLLMVRMAKARLASADSVL
jgi:hypothetical protein